MVPRFLGLSVREPSILRGSGYTVRKSTPIQPLNLTGYPSYLSIYSSLLIAAEVIYTSVYLFYSYGAMRASKVISMALVDSVLGSSLRCVQVLLLTQLRQLLIPTRWLDETPTARIITRCTQDIRAVDGPIPQFFGSLTETSMTLFTKIAAIIFFTPLFVFPGLGVAAFGLYLGNLYLKAQMSVKREMR